MSYLFELYNLGFLVCFSLLMSLDDITLFFYTLCYFVLNVAFKEYLINLEITSFGIEKSLRWICNFVLTIYGLLISDQLKKHNFVAYKHLKNFHFTVFCIFYCALYIV